MKKRIGLVREYVKLHTKICDLGAGKGEYYQKVDLAGKEIVLVDIKGWYLKHITDYFPQMKTIVQDLQEKIDLPDDYFDLIIISQVIEHLKVYTTTLKEAKRMCKIGGYILLGVPKNDPDHGHIHIFSNQEEVENIGKELGEIEKVIEGGNYWYIYVRKTI